MPNKLFLLLMIMGISPASASPDAQHHRLKTNVTDEATLKSPQTEALNHNKLLNDPLSPRVGAEHPLVTVVSFTNYDCAGCKQIDRNLERLLKAYPQIVVTYKLLSYGPEETTAATRMALTVWIKHPEKFQAVHHVLMSYKGMPDDSLIYSAIIAAGIKLSMYRPGTQHIIDLNKALLKNLHLPGTPATIIGDKVLLGAVTYEALEEALKVALTDAKDKKHQARKR